jgi:hypothetical protein
MSGNDELKIERGIPIPKRRQTGLTPALLKLDVGDSVLSKSKIQSIYSVIGHVRKKHPERTFETRAMDGGTRIWRTA